MQFSDTLWATLLATPQVSHLSRFELSLENHLATHLTTLLATPRTAI